MVELISIELVLDALQIAIVIRFVMSGCETRNDPSAPDCDRHFSGPCRARGPGVTRSATGSREFQLRTEKLASRRSRQNPMGRDSAAPREAGENSIIAENYRRKRNPGYAQIVQKRNLSSAQPENPLFFSRENPFSSPRFFYYGKSRKLYQ